MTSTLTKTLPIHPYCEMFPPMGEKDRANLKASIKEKGGLDDPIIEYDRQVLDGRHRQELCIELGIEPVYKLFQFPRNCQNKDAELLRFVKSRNLDRRHLTTSQLAMMAAKLATLKHGQRKGGPDAQHCASQLDEAVEFGIGRRSVQAAAAVLNNGDSSLVEAVQQAKIAVSDAAKIVDLPKPKQAQAVKAVEAGESKTVAAAANKLIGARGLLQDENPSKGQLAPDPEGEPISLTQAEIEQEFKRLRKNLTAGLTALRKTRALASSLNKLTGGGEMLIRILDDTQDDCKQCGRLLQLWSDQKGGGA